MTPEARPRQGQAQPQGTSACAGGCACQCGQACGQDPQASEGEVVWGQYPPSKWDADLLSECLASDANPEPLASPVVAPPVIVNPAYLARGTSGHDHHGAPRARGDHRSVDTRLLTGTPPMRFFSLGESDECRCDKCLGGNKQVAYEDCACGSSFCPECATPSDRARKPAGATAVLSESLVSSGTNTASATTCTCQIRSTATATNSSGSSDNRRFMARFLDRYRRTLGVLSK